MVSTSFRGFVEPDAGASARAKVAETHVVAVAVFDARDGLSQDSSPMWR